jgi:hypothetical protein
MRFALLLLLLVFTSGLIKAGGLAGKVMCGYQGWFRVPDDGSNNGWFHYSSGRSFEPGRCNIDLWPDVRELPAADRFPTPFKFADGTTAEVFSSVRPATVDLHFQWMRDYGIDGVFVQRFAGITRDERFRKPTDLVLDACRKAAQNTGRSWVLMYDLSGVTKDAAQVVITDWKRLEEQYHLTDAEKNPAYLRHRDRPLVALWGCGFNDRPPMLDEWRTMIRFFKSEARCSLMLGVPAYWRTLDRDSITDPELHKLISEADVVSPWNVGRYDSPAAAVRHAEKTTAPDISWCRERRLDYLPVAFPGFSWHNLSASRAREQKLDAIPRRGGQFLWSQFQAFQKAGANAVYVAMFDELDEGTAIFKIRQDPPVGASPFVAEKDVPGDHYLWLTGMGGRLMRGQIPGEAGSIPKREP